MIGDIVIPCFQKISLTRLKYFNEIMSLCVKFFDPSIELSIYFEYKNFDSLQWLKYEAENENFALNFNMFNLEGFTFELRTDDENKRSLCESMLKNKVVNYLVIMSFCKVFNCKIIVMDNFLEVMKIYILYLRFYFYKKVYRKLTIFF